MRRIALLALLALALLAAGCATIANDQKETIPVRSEPDGAVVSIECGNTPVYGGITPAVIIIERTADPCAVTVAKEGYEAKKVTLERTTSRAMRGNKVPGMMMGALFGLIAWFSDDVAIDVAWDLGSALGEAPGNAIDRRTGAAYKHVPKEVFVRLDPTP
jgi:hypothetical protein